MIRQIAQGAAQDIARMVEADTDAARHGVSVGVSVGLDTQLRYFIFTTDNGAIESIRLLCHATSVDRLRRHVEFFIEHLKN